MRHGAKVKRCSSEGCTNNVLNGGVCRRHGAKKKRCSSEGCRNEAIKGGVCMRHGAKRKQCSSEGCNNKAVKGGVCRRHGAYHTSNDVSTAFGTELDEPIAPFSLPNRGNYNASHEQGVGVPTEVLVTQEIVEV